MLLALLLTPPVHSLAAQAREQADTARADSLRPVLLSPVIVSVTREATEASRVPLAVSVLDRQEIIKGRPGVDIAEALSTLPGVYVADRHNPSQDDNLSIRGFGARSAFGVRGVKVLLDGIPQTLPDGQGQLTNIEWDQVQRAEVIRGPASSLYGNASGGVISLSTHTQRPSQFGAVLRATAGAYGSRKGYAGLAMPAGAGDLAADLSVWSIDGYRDHSSGDTRRASLRYRTDVGGQTHIVGQLLLADSPLLQDPGALTATEPDTAANPRNVAADAGKSVSQEQAGLALERRTNAGGSVNATVFALHRDLENPIATTYIQLGRWAYGGRASLVRPLAVARRPLVVTTGMDTQFQRDDRMNLTTDRTRVTRDQLERVSELGPFVQGRLAISSVVSALLGLRYDRIAFRVDDRLLSDGDDSGTRVMASPSASAGLTLDLGAPLQPYASVSTSFDTPTTTELANRPTGPGGFNPDLKPQKAVNYEAGARGRASGIVGYELSLYQADVRDELIPFEVPGDPGRRFYRNAGTARHRGVEVGVALHPVTTVAIVGSYTLSDFRFREFRTATDTLDGNEIPGVPRHYGYASVRYQAPVGLWGALDLTVSSGHYVDDANSVRTAGWQTLGLRLGWEGHAVSGVSVSPFAAIQNVFNERYVGSVAVNAQFGRYFEPAPPRNAYVGLQVRAF